MKWYVVYSGRVSRTQSSFQTCHEQVNGYKNNCYRGFKTRDGAEDDYSKFIVKLKIDHLGPHSVAGVLVEGANAEAHGGVELIERDKLSDGHRAGAVL